MPPTAIDPRAVSATTSVKSGKHVSSQTLSKTPWTCDKNVPARSTMGKVGIGRLEVVYDGLRSKKKAGSKNDAVKAAGRSITIENDMIDIIAIPGLQASAEAAWSKCQPLTDQEAADGTQTRTSPSCIEHRTMLPRVLPNSRIMNLSCLSKWPEPGESTKYQSVIQRIGSMTKLLLRELQRLRKTCPNRPLIFLAYSLGGLIVEQAVTRSKSQPKYFEIYNSVAGCVFLGTPFRDSEFQAKAASAATVGSAFNVAEFALMLELMRRDSARLAELLAEFAVVIRKANIETFCFFELTGDKDSSTLSGENSQGFNRNHFDMNKFESNSDRDWIDLSSVIERIAHKAPHYIKHRRNALPETISAKHYSRIVATLAASEADLEADVKAIKWEKGEAIADIAKLMSRNAKINNWLSSHTAGILWISLQPGMSSVMVGLALKQGIEATIQEGRFDRCLTYFLCDVKDIRKNNTPYILKHLIRQMITETPSLAVRLPIEQQRAFERKQQGCLSPGWDKYSNLKAAFTSMLRELAERSVTIIIDSLHELDKGSQSQLLGLINETCNSSYQDESYGNVKWICFGLDRSDLVSMMQKATVVTADELASPAEWTKSLKSLVRDRVAALSTTLGYSREYAFWLRTELSNRADGNTTWIDLACREIESVGPKPVELRSFVENLGQGLTPLYKQIQKRVLRPGSEGLDYTKEILRTLMITFDNPTLREIAVLADLPPDSWNDLDEIREFIRRCGSFVKVVSDGSTGRVQFMDTTVLKHLEREAANDLGHHDRLSTQHGVIALRSLNFMVNSTDEDHPASSGQVAYPKRFWLTHAQRASEDFPDLVEDFGLDTDFWKPGGVAWWPNVKHLTARHPSLKYLTVVHLAAYFGFHALLDSLLAEDSIHRTAVNTQDSLGRTPLFWASSEGHFDAVKKLVACGAKIDEPGVKSSTGTPLWGAAANGHYEIVKWLLERKAIVDVPDGQYGTALCTAARGGHVEVVKALLQAGASKTAKPSPLMAACHFGHSETVKLLIQESCDVNVFGNDGTYALQHAVRLHDTELIAIILSCGANLQSRQMALNTATLNGFEEAIRLILAIPDGLSLRQPLLNVARLGHTTALNHFQGLSLTQQVLDDALYNGTDMENLEVVEKLLAMGANPNAQGEVYGYVLQIAARNGTLSVMQMLMNHGANVNSVGGVYGTALQAAASNGDKDSMTLLLDAGANINGRPVGTYGNPLYAAIANKHQQASRLLIDSGADVNAPGGENSYAILQAAFCADSDMVRYLIKHGADVQVRSKHENNVFLAAAYALPKEDLQYLCEMGADIHACDRNGNTALILCSASRDLESVQWLLEVRADVNDVSTEIGSALQAAVDVSCMEICRVLLDHGADPNQYDDHNSPPLIKAAELNDMEIFKILLARGANVRFRSDQWGNLLEASIQGGNADILTIVLEKTGFDVDSVLRHQGTPLHMASRQKQGGDIIDVLLDRGADPNVVGGKYRTPLQAAAYHNIGVRTKQLLDHSADKTIRGGFYGTAANAAAAKGHLNLLELLLDTEGGAAVDEALHYAIHYHRSNVVEELLSKFNANVTSIGRWGNTFQALSSVVIDEELNSDDEDETDLGADDGNESEDEAEDGDEIEDAEAINRHEAAARAMTDRQRVQKVDDVLRAAFEMKGIDHMQLPKDPFTVGLPRSKTSWSMMHKQSGTDRATDHDDDQGTGLSMSIAHGVATNGDDASPIIEDNLPEQATDRSTSAIPRLSMIPPTQQHLVRTSGPVRNRSMPPMQAQASETYHNDANDKLLLTQNEIVTVLDSISDKDWWKVQKADGREALVPASRMKVVHGNRQLEPPPTIRRKAVNSPIPLLTVVTHEEGETSGLQFVNTATNSPGQLQESPYEDSSSFGIGEVPVEAELESMEADWEAVDLVQDDDQQEAETVSKPVNGTYQAEKQKNLDGRVELQQQETKNLALEIAARSKYQEGGIRLQQDSAKAQLQGANVAQERSNRTEDRTVLDPIAEETEKESQIKAEESAIERGALPETPTRKSRPEVMPKVPDSVQVNGHLDPESDAESVSKPLPDEPPLPIIVPGSTNTPPRTSTPTQYTKSRPISTYSGPKGHVSLQYAPHPQQQQDQQQQHSPQNQQTGSPEQSQQQMHTSPQENHQPRKQDLRLSLHTQPQVSAQQQQQPQNQYQPFHPQLQPQQLQQHQPQQQPQSQAHQYLQYKQYQYEQQQQQQQQQQQHQYQPYQKQQYQEQIQPVPSRKSLQALPPLQSQQTETQNATWQQSSTGVLPHDAVSKTKGWFKKRFGQATL